MTKRILRVREILKRELGTSINRLVRFESPLVTISDVDITPDLKQAHIFISAMGTPAQRKDALAKLNEKRAALQSEFAKRVVLKNTPQLTFHIDDSVERGDRVLEIMSDLGLLNEEKPPSENE
ncbi:MAG: 30S ribosome-binding factor RbfA [Chthoniobacterales bacterium]